MINGFTRPIVIERFRFATSHLMIPVNFEYCTMDLC